MVEWDSPIFGLLVGEAVESTASTITVWHPLTDKLMTIPAAQVTRILSEGKMHLRDDV